MIHMVAAMDIIDQYFEEIESAVHAINREDARVVVDVLEKAWRDSRTVYLIGNGGSASTASHMMNDLCKFTAMPGVARVRAVALTDNVPLMTAYGNDNSYDDIFLEPLATLAQPGDVLVAISGSGNSRNIIKCCEYALEAGMTVIGLCGRPGGKLANLATHRVIVPADRIGQQEDGHLILNHAIALALRERIQAATQLRAQALDP